MIVVQDVHTFIKWNSHQVHSDLCNFNVTLLQHSQLGATFKDCSVKNPANCNVRLSAFWKKQTNWVHYMWHTHTSDCWFTPVCHSVWKSLETNSKKDLSPSCTAALMQFSVMDLSYVWRTDPTSGIQSYWEKPLALILVEFRVR